MTAEEIQLTEAQRILDGSRCKCGEYGATIYHEPGYTEITCNHCQRSVCAPDFEINQALALWAWK